MKVMDKTISQITVPTPFAVGDVHIYLLKGDLLSIIDAGVKTKEAWETLKEQLKRMGYFPKDIEQVILTHHHPDHIGLIDQFPRAERIIAHANVDPWIQRDELYLQHYKQFFEKYFSLSGIPETFLPYLNKLSAPLNYVGKGELTRFIDEGDELPGHPGWQVIDTKGHAQSHLSFLRKTDRLLVGGDHILEHISSNPLMEPPSPGESIEFRPKPMLQYRRNLQKCIDLRVDCVLPGHGQVVQKPKSLIENRLKKQQERADKVFDLLITQPQTPFQLCTQIFPRQFKNQIDLTMSETIGQLDYLENEGRITKKTEDGKLIYYAN
ncbi:MAG: MBL fold metallo-hydrolase [Bacillota bacterium]|uniref:MBL fold metallo-hydrolase n=1 Tax=Virgibacillus salarius TaxID=447199 RepID=A0A941ID16_9BACI|nr:MULTISPECIES: MBL fold metallo-hydrolase [Virgibacillus]MBR7796710.1 MBL fold metallo-hydrolase [Virgibacillus salarius]MCC2249149.1 MBL fold metallo-hydrolase [Virgibacillus sp. AGTR]MDY7043451.1 MBL fold metallo-hydrolase [Virgibacillus sp. M23]QRZ16945.1 MBL fold metallo-hydrolase [Virgibacillus sp. AGTR]